MSVTTSPEAPLQTSSPFKEIGPDLINNPGQWFEESLKELWSTIYTFLPVLLGALATLLVGWLAAVVLRWMIHRFGKGLDAIMAIVQRWLGHEVSRSRWSFSRLVGDFVFWITIAYAISAAAEQVGLVLFSNWVLGLLGYLPRVLISVFILLIGYLISKGVRDLVMEGADASGYRYGTYLSQLSAGLILAFTLLLALGQLGLDVTVFEYIITLAVAALFLGVAIAFGLGSADAVRNVMASHYVRRFYRPGQRVELKGLEGVIVDLTQVDVIIETDDGDARIPARCFLENITRINSSEVERA
jgi:small-conductance mechanosensitive channel